MHVNPAPEETAPPNIYAAHPAYNLFRRRQEPDVLCAVPEDRPVPSFINANGWEFAGKADEPATLPLGFNQKAARVSVRCHGFYLFEAFSAVRKRTAIWPPGVLLAAERRLPEWGDGSNH
jgi:hypothetical protein